MAVAVAARLGHTTRRCQTKARFALIMVWSLDLSRLRPENVTAALEKLPGTRPFPGGPDLSEVT